MNFFAVFMSVFSVLGAIDRIIGNRFGLGKQFEKGFQMFAPAALSMIGMIVLAPLLADLLQPILHFMATTLKMEPSILPATLFANDMGGTALAQQTATGPAIGRYNGFIVAAMMGVTVSFTVPLALTMVKKEQHKDMLLGFLCGIITIPVGCFVGGPMMGIPLGALLWDLLPLLIFAAVLACCLWFFPNTTIKVFQVLGSAIRILITIGLAIGIVEFLTGYNPLAGKVDGLESGADICVNACVVYTGTLPFLHILSKLLDRPLKWLGSKLGINETAALGFVSSLATSVTTYGIMENMDRKGVVLNSAFTISAAFVFASHLAFTMAMDTAAIVPVIVSKLVAGLCAVVLAFFVFKKFSQKTL